MEERRRGDRRQGTESGRAPGTERRKYDRRKLAAGVGLAALLAGTAPRIAGYVKEHLAGEESGSAVDVATGNFRILKYDRAALDALIHEASRAYGVSADLVKAVIQTESAFDPMAVSPVGAQGLMQLMPPTARHLGIKDPFDPRQNIFGGVKYLSILLDRFHGNTALALASYNAGPTVVDRHKGIPPYGETRGYVQKIRGLVADTASAFALPAPRRPLRRAVLTRRAGRHTALTKVARATRSSSRGRATLVSAVRKGSKVRPSVRLVHTRSSARRARTRSSRA
jgi:transglycosylase-like protein with SLT domain